jgi:hypothetical protein
MIDRWSTDDAQLAEEAREARLLPPEQRVKLFASIMDTIQGVWGSLPFEEQWRRVRLAEQIDGARPEPWWSGVREDQRPGVSSELQQLLDA